MKKLNKAALYNGLLTGFFWLVQFSDLLRVKWFFDTLMQDSTVASWAMTLVVELGMGLLSLDLLRRVTANAQRTWRTAKDGTRKQIGYRQPITLLIFSVSVLGILESFISIAFFYEFGQVTKLTSRLLGGDTLYTAAAFGVLGAVLTFVFAAVEGERTRIAEQEREKVEAKQERAEAKRVRRNSTGTRAEQKRDVSAQERVLAALKAEPGATGKQIAELAGCSESYARRIKRAYEETGNDHDDEQSTLNEQIALVLQTDCPTREKVWMLHLLKQDQEAIATLLDVSLDYVSASFEEMPEDLGNE